MVNNPNCDWYYKEERKHEEILTQRIRSACKVAMWVSAISIIGLVGSAELDKISIAQFVVYELIAVAVFLISIRAIDNI